MIARIHKSMNEKDKDKGFTLIELLVVIIIIGILSAIAIPVFMNQRKKAVDSSLKSDLRTVANEMETVYVDEQAYFAAAGATGKTTIAATTPVVVTTTAGNTVTGTLTANGTGYCLVGSAAAGKATQDWVYKSESGGLQAKSVTDCK